MNIFSIILYKFSFLFTNNLYLFKVCVTSQDDKAKVPLGKTAALSVYAGLLKKISWALSVYAGY